MNNRRKIIYNNCDTMLWIDWHFYLRSKSVSYYLYLRSKPIQLLIIISLNLSVCVCPFNNYKCKCWSIKYYISCFQHKIVQQILFSLVPCFIFSTTVPTIGFWSKSFPNYSFYDWENYDFWAVKVESYLEEFALWEVVEEDWKYICCIILSWAKSKLIRIEKQGRQKQRCVLLLVFLRSSSQRSQLSS